MAKVASTLNRPTRRRKQTTDTDTGAVYGYRTLRVDPATGLVLGDGSIMVGYVGQTVQPIEDRDEQHRGLQPNPFETEPNPQPWEDTIHGEIFVIESEVPVDKLDKRELHHIEQLMPAYNHVGQPESGNPNRIMMSDARRHRDTRDRAKNLPPREWPAFRSGWQPTEPAHTPRSTSPRPASRPAQPTAATRKPATNAQPRRARPAPMPVVARSPWEARVRFAAFWLFLAAGLWVGAWWLVDVWLGHDLAPELGASVSAGGSLLLVRAGMWRPRRR